MASESQRDGSGAILSDPQVKIVRLGPLERWILPGVLLFAFGWIGIYEMTLGSVGAALGGFCFLLVAAVVALTAMFRVMLAVGTDSMLIRNAVRTHVVALVDVAEVEPEYEGLRIVTTSGTKLTASAVQRWNISLFLRRRSQADRIADLILERKAAATSRLRNA